MSHQTEEGFGWRTKEVSRAAEVVSDTRNSEVCFLNMGQPQPLIHLTLVCLNTVQFFSSISLMD